MCGGDWGFGYVGDGLTESNSPWTSDSPSLGLSFLTGNFQQLSLELSKIMQVNGLAHCLTLVCPQTWMIGYVNQWSPLFPIIITISKTLEVVWSQYMENLERQQRHVVLILSTL